MILYKQVQKKIADQKILSDINIVINNGEFVSIVGPSGAGKSSFLKMLWGELLPDRGTLTVDGVSLSNMKPNALQLYRRHIGVVHQEFLLLEKKTVYENVAFAMEVCNDSFSTIKKRVVAVLDIVGLKQKKDHYPSQLSGGEKQRTAIARALVHHPKLLLADEPTGNLDPQNSLDIFDLLVKINTLNTTVVVTTHDEAIVNKLGKRVITLNKGMVVSDRIKGRYRRVKG